MGNSIIGRANPCGSGPIHNIVRRTETPINPVAPALRFIGEGREFEIQRFQVCIEDRSQSQTVDRAEVRTVRTRTVRPAAVR